MSLLLILCRLVSLFAINLFQYVLLASCIFAPNSSGGVWFWVHVRLACTHLLLCSRKMYPITILIRKFELMKYGPKLLRFIYIAGHPSGDVPSDIDLFLWSLSFLFCPSGTIQSITGFSNRSGWFLDVSDCKSMFAAKVLKDRLLIPCCTEVMLEKSSSQYSCNVGEFAVMTAWTNGSIYLWDNGPCLLVCSASVSQLSEFCEFSLVLPSRVTPTERFSWLFPSMYTIGGILWLDTSSV